MNQNQSNQSGKTTQVGVRIPAVLDHHIAAKAKDGFRNKSDEMRMLMSKGFEAVYGYNPEEAAQEQRAA